MRDLNEAGLVSRCATTSQRASLPRRVHGAAGAAQRQRRGRRADCLTSSRAACAASLRPEPGSRCRTWAGTRSAQRVKHPVFEGIADGANFYFVHSYYPDPEDRDVSARPTTACASPACSRQTTWWRPSSTRRRAARGLRFYGNFCRLAWRPGPLMEVIPAIDLRAGSVRPVSTRATTIRPRSSIRIRLPWPGAGWRPAPAGCTWSTSTALFRARPRTGRRSRRSAGRGRWCRSSSAAASATARRPPAGLIGGSIGSIFGTLASSSRTLAAELIADLGDRVVVSLDARDGFVTTRGWTETSELRVEDALDSTVRAGLRRIVYTDISRDGTLTEPNFDAIAAVVKLASIPVIASGASPARRPRSPARHRRRGRHRREPSTPATSRRRCSAAEEPPTGLVRRPVGPKGGA